jgi:hypothetical protein
VLALARPSANRYGVFLKKNLDFLFK